MKDIRKLRAKYNQSPATMQQNAEFSGRTGQTLATMDKFSSLPVLRYSQSAAVRANLVTKFATFCVYRVECCFIYCFF